MRKISPSMMCASINRLEEVLTLFSEEKIEYLHIDVMDGVFVPNLMLGTDYVKQIRTLSKIPLDIHLMVVEPKEKIAWFSPQPGEIISVQFEACLHLQATLQTIRSFGARAFVALNPATPIDVLRYVLEDIDGVLIMTVNPGFAGQKAIPAAVQKIADLRHFLDKHGYENIEIEVDGNVSYELASKMSENHADIFVAGSSSFFCHDATMEEMRTGIARLRNAIG